MCFQEACLSNYPIPLLPQNSCNHPIPLFPQNSCNYPIPLLPQHSCNYPIPLLPQNSCYYPIPLLPLNSLCNENETSASHSMGCMNCWTLYTISSVKATVLINIFSISVDLPSCSEEQSSDSVRTSWRRTQPPSHGAVLSTPTGQHLARTDHITRTTLGTNRSYSMDIGQHLARRDH